MFACVAMLSVAVVTPARAETTAPSTMSSLLETLKSLMAKVADLQVQLATVKGEVSIALKDGLTQGSTDDDVKKVQELLASDSTIYPSGKVTGFFGKMTGDALKKFQQKHGLPETGVIDAETKALLDSYLEERKGDHTKKGFLQSSDMMQKVHDKLCGDGTTTPRMMPPRGGDHMSSSTMMRDHKEHMGTGSSTRPARMEGERGNMMQHMMHFCADKKGGMKDKMPKMPPMMMPCDKVASSSTTGGENHPMMLKFCNDHKPGDMMKKMQEMHNKEMGGGGAGEER